MDKWTGVKPVKSGGLSDKLSGIKHIKEKTSLAERLEGRRNKELGKIK